MSAPQVPSAEKNHPRMQRVDLSNDHLTEAQRQKIESYNRTQHQKFQKKIGFRRARILGICVTSFVFSIYGYTVYQMAKDKDLIGEMEKEVMEFNK